MNSNLTKAYKATRILETLNNYSVAADLNVTAHRNFFPSQHNRILEVDADKHFWQEVLTNPEACWNKSYSFGYCTISEWVPRIPGLYWSKGSAAIRAFADAEIVKEMPGHIEYNPPGKSSRVIGGVGTLRLPEDVSGNRLFTLTSSGNSSVGIPILFTADQLEKLTLKQGDVITVHKAFWKKMSIEWARQFSSTTGFPRGYLTVHNLNDIDVLYRGQPVEYHPFSVMEYQQGDALLFDYVFVTAVSDNPNARNRIEKFFKNYRTKEGRNGSYLLACDISTPLFDSRYTSPAEMKSAYENSQMNMIEKRIQKEYFNEHTLQEIATILPKFYKTSTAILTLAGLLELPVARLATDAAAKMSSQLIELCYNENKIAYLIDRITQENPNIFKN